MICGFTIEGGLMLAGASADSAAKWAFYFGVIRMSCVRFRFRSPDHKPTPIGSPTIAAQPMCQTANAAQTKPLRFPATLKDDRRPADLADLQRQARLQSLVAPEDDRHICTGCPARAACEVALLGRGGFGFFGVEVAR
jgi:hypothetical protein